MKRLLTLCFLAVFVAAGCSSARETAGDVGEAVGGAAVDVVEGAGDVAGDVIDGAADAGQAVAGVAVDVGEGAGDVAGDVIDGAADAGQAVGGAVASGYNTAEDAVQHSGNAVGNAVTGTYNDVEDAVQGGEDDDMPMMSYSASDITWMNDDDATGTITFSPMSDHYALQSEFSGLRNGNYMMRVHEGTSCQSPGGAYVPMGRNGWSMSAANQDNMNRMGMFTVSNGMASYEGMDYGLTMHGRRNLEGRVVAFYDANGNRVGCGLIGNGTASR